MDPDFPFPQFPEVTDEIKAKARETQSYMPIAVRFFKSSCIAAITFASIETRSTIWRKIPKIEQNILRGLFSRIGHLGKSMLKLSQDGDSREIIFIISRTLNETAINVQWCLNKDSEQRFKLFIDAGVQGDLELRNQILKNIKDRGSTLLLEERMLKSLDQLATTSDFLWDAIELKAKMPDFYRKLKDLGKEKLYLVMQKLPSQSVHGSWSDLVMHYLEEKNGELVPRDETLSSAHDILYLFPSMLILDALIDASRHCFIGEDIQEIFANYFSTARDDVLALIRDSAGDDFLSARS